MVVCFGRLSIPILIPAGLVATWILQLGIPRVAADVPRTSTADIRGTCCPTPVKSVETDTLVAAMFRNPSPNSSVYWEHLESLTFVLFGAREGDEYLINFHLTVRSHPSSYSLSWRSEFTQSWSMNLSAADRFKHGQFVTACFVQDCKMPFLSFASYDDVDFELQVHIFEKESITDSCFLEFSCHFSVHALTPLTGCFCEDICDCEIDSKITSFRSKVLSLDWIEDAAAVRTGLFPRINDLLTGISQMRDHRTCSPPEGVELLESIPIFVLNNPSRSDRRLHTLCLLKSVGFTNVSFINFTKASDVNVSSAHFAELVTEETLRLMKGISWISAEGLNSYLANAYDHIKAIRDGVAAGYEMFGIFEDDLLPSGSPILVNSNIKQAIAELPQTADMLYAEACWEKCSSVRFATDFKYIARAFNPAGCAAIFFTKKGAKRAARFFNKIFLGMDNMYQVLIRSELLEAYLMTPIPFFQDAFWGSGMPSRDRTQWKISLGHEPHRPVQKLCLEEEFPQPHILQIFTWTPYFSILFHDEPDKSEQRDGVVLLIHGVLSGASSWRLHGATNVTVFGVHKDDGEVEEYVGELPGLLSGDGIAWYINSENSCWANISECMIRIELLYNTNVLPDAIDISFRTAIKISEAVEPPPFENFFQTIISDPADIQSNVAKEVPHFSVYLPANRSNSPPNSQLIFNFISSFRNMIAAFDLPFIASRYVLHYYDCANLERNHMDSFKQNLVLHQAVLALTLEVHQCENDAERIALKYSAKSLFALHHNLWHRLRPFIWSSPGEYHVRNVAAGFSFANLLDSCAKDIYKWSISTSSFKVSPGSFSLSKISPHVDDEVLITIKGNHSTVVKALCSSLGQIELYGFSKPEQSVVLDSNLNEFRTNESRWHEEPITETSSGTQDSKSEPFHGQQPHARRRADVEENYCWTLRQFWNPVQVMSYVIYSDENYLSILQNSVIALRKIGIDHVLVLTSNQEAARQVSISCNIPAFPLSEWGLGYGQDGIWLTRYKALLQLLKCGHGVAFVDADIVFLRNPDGFWDFDQDIEFGQGIYPPELFSSWGFTATAGFARINANERTIAFYSKLISNMESHSSGFIEHPHRGVDDQVSLNYLLNSSKFDYRVFQEPSGTVVLGSAQVMTFNVTMRILPTLMFPVGGGLNRLKNVLFSSKCPYLLHPNSISKHSASKELWLRCQGLWYIQGGESESHTMECPQDHTILKGLASICSPFAMDRTHTGYEHELEISAPEPGASIDESSLNVTLMVHSISACKMTALAVRIGSELFAYQRLPADQGCGTSLALKLTVLPKGLNSLEIFALDCQNVTLGHSNLMVHYSGSRISDYSDATCLLSYPHSGNHWVRMVLEFLTLRPTVGCRENPLDVAIHRNIFSIPHPLSDVDPFATPIAFKFHYSNSSLDCTVPITRCRRLITIVRNFGECIPRHLEHPDYDTQSPQENRIIHESRLYLDNILTFIQFQGDKLLLRYDGIVSNPSDFDSLISFLGNRVSKHRIRLFNFKFERLKQQSKAATGRNWLGVRETSKSYVHDWEAAEVCEFAVLFDELVKSYPIEVRQIVAAYNNTFDGFKRTCGPEELPILQVDKPHDVEVVALDVELEGGISTWPNGASAAVTLTYDDGKVQTLGLIADMLNEFDLKGTFFIPSAYMQAPMSDHVKYFEPAMPSDPEWVLQTAKRRLEEGHEIACHSHTHTNFYQDKDIETAVEEMDRCSAFFLQEFGKNNTTHAYPRGIGSDQSMVKAYASQLYRAGRSTEQVMTSKTPTDIQSIPCLFEGAEMTFETARSRLLEAKATGSWLCTFNHGTTTEDGSPISTGYSAAPWADLMEYFALLAAENAEHSITVNTFEAIVKFVAARDSSYAAARCNCSNVWRGGEKMGSIVSTKITVEASGSIESPLTVFVRFPSVVNVPPQVSFDNMVDLPHGWSRVSVDVKDKTLWYISVIPPEGGGTCLIHFFADVESCQSFQSHSKVVGTERQESQHEATEVGRKDQQAPQSDRKLEYVNLDQGGVISLYDQRQEESIVYNSAHERANVGAEGGEWSWCTHLVNYGLNFNQGLARFITFQLSPRSVLEFGCGIGLYLDFQARFNPHIEEAVGIEPLDMTGAGIFGRWRGKIRPVQLAINIFESDQIFEVMSEFDVVYSIEVAEHIPVNLHPKLVDFLVSKTRKFLVFSAARPGQSGLGHFEESMRSREDWISTFEKQGLVHLPKLSSMVRDVSDSRNINHRINLFVMAAKSYAIDTDVRHFRVVATQPEESTNSLFPDLALSLERVQHSGLCSDYSVDEDFQVHSPSIDSKVTQQGDSIRIFRVLNRSVGEPTLVLNEEIANIHRNGDESGFVTIGDPCLVSDNNFTFLFFRADFDVPVQISVIAAVVSSDSRHWSTPIIVLKESFSLSTPQVFMHDGSWYMLPSEDGGEKVTLYKANNFPFDWRPIRILFSGEQYRAPQIFTLSTKLYVSVWVGSEALTRKTFSADDILGEWGLCQIEEGGMTHGGPLFSQGDNVWRMTHHCAVLGCKVWIELIQLATAMANPIKGPIHFDAESGFFDAHISYVSLLRKSVSPDFALIAVDGTWIESPREYDMAPESRNPLKTAMLGLYSPLLKECREFKPDMPWSEDLTYIQSVVEAANLQDNHKILFIEGRTSFSSSMLQLYLPFNYISRCDIRDRIASDFDWISNCEDAVQLDSNFFDAVIMHGVSSKQFGFLFGSVVRILKPDGSLVVGLPFDFSFSSDFLKYFYSHYRSAEELNSDFSEQRKQRVHIFTKNSAVPDNGPAPSLSSSTNVHTGDTAPISLTFGLHAEVRPILLKSYIQYVVESDIPGDILEAGVHKGKSTRAFAEEIVRLKSNKQLWLYDAWEGMPIPDRSRDGPESMKYIGWGGSHGKLDPASIEDVQSMLNEVGFGVEQATFRKGWFDKTFLLPGPSRIAVLHVDCDFYNASLLTLETFYDRVVDGGVVAFDDFGHWEGQRIAFYDFVRSRNLYPLLERVGHTMAWFVKGKQHNRDSHRIWSRPNG